MQPPTTPETNRTLEVIPPIRHAVPWRVTDVRVMGEACLRVTFVDGTTGEVDMGAFLRNPKVEGTVFEPLRAAAVFAQVQTILGAVQWPTGADLAPDAMYDAIREDGAWVLD